MDHSKLVDHLATIIRLYLSRSRWLALASVEQVAIKSAEYNLEQARTKATTRRAFSFPTSPLSHRRIFRESSEYGGYGAGSQLAWFIFAY